MKNRFRVMIVDLEEGKEIANDEVQALGMVLMREEEMVPIAAGLFNMVDAAKMNAELCSLGDDILDKTVDNAMQQTVEIGTDEPSKRR